MIRHGVGDHPRTSDMIGPTRTRILLLVILSAEQGRPITLRELRDQCGLKSHNAVTEHLKALRRDGLVEWDRKRSRTLMPTCRFLSPEQL